jgi:hypothetical protein
VTRSVQAAGDGEVDRDEYIASWRRAVQEVALLAHQCPYDADGRVLEPLKQVGGWVV